MQLLVTSIEELQEFLNVYSSFNYETMRPFIRIAEKKFIKRAMGAEMYAELVSNYQASVAANDAVAMGDDMKLLWEKAAEAIAHLAMYEGGPSFNVAMTDGGATRIETEGIKSAYQYQVEDYRRSRKDQGFRALDELIQHLDENEDLFTTYKSSATRTALKQSLIQDATTFSKYRDISESRWIFLLMRSQMDRIEQTRIKSVLGESRYGTIKSELLTALSAENLDLMENYIRPAIAHLSFASAIIDLAVNVDDRGVTVYNTESARGTIVTYKESPENYLFNLRKSELEKGESDLAMLEKKVRELDATEEDPDYASRMHTSEDDAGFASLM